MSATSETAPCECSEHKCIPVPKQTMRYRVRVGPGAEGLVALCAHCYVNGHLAGYEFRFQAHNRAEEARNT